MIGIVGNINDYFRGSREHDTEFRGTGEFDESQFQGTTNNKGRQVLQVNTFARIEMVEVFVHFHL